ncbi:MAG: alpha/beta fold hydrolase [Proteobacteria bacterium]|nr:alpha/beta fold hydrolase [Pseudomonadota bacterium]
MSTQETPAFRLPDPVETGRILSDLAQNAHAAMLATAERAAQPQVLPYDPMAVGKAFSDFATSLMLNPLKLAETTARNMQEWGELWTSAAARAMGQEAAPVIEPAKGDRRFSAPAWSDEPVYDYLKQAYLLAASQLQAMTADADLPSDTKVKVDFFARRLIDALSPANYAHTNPEVVRKTLETGGLNLMGGLSNLLQDVAQGRELVSRRAPDAFELGVNIAATPGAVVFQNDLLQLIQYAPTTEEVRARPLLFVPPLVNKYYLFDLTPKSSYLKWLVDQGHTVFVVSWVNPTEQHAAKDLKDYVLDGVVASIDAALKATGQEQVDLVSYCLGGTLSAIALGYLAATGRSDTVATATLIATLVDFKDLGDWSAFLGEQDVEAFNRYLDAKGYVEADHLAQLFSTVRANDLIWSSVVKHYLLDEEARPSDLLWWFDDGSRIPAAMLQEYVRLMLLQNRLREPNGVTIDGVGIDLGKVKSKVFVVALKDDHVAAWKDTYEGMKLFGGETRFLLGGSGHNAGMINPPGAGKHGYWTASVKAQSGDAEAWLAAATRHADSWWPEWQGWISKDAKGAPVPAVEREPGKGALPALEAAPGSYVKVKH